MQNDKTRPIEEELATTLKEMRTRFGEGAFSSRRRLLSLLADRMPSAVREIKVLALALEDGAVEALANAGPHLPLEIDRLCSAMEMRYGTSPAVARPVLLALAHGLGLVPSSSIGAWADDWVGLSSVAEGAPAPEPAEAGATPEEAHRAEAPSTPPRAKPKRRLLIGVLIALGLFAASEAWLASQTQPASPGSGQSPAPVTQPLGPPPLPETVPASPPPLPSNAQGLPPPLPQP